MWLNEDAPIHKQNLVLSKPFVNSAGILGFTPDPHAMPYLDHMGAFITHPISRRPRRPAGNRCCLPFPGGFLLHTGLPNPGVSRAVKRFSRAWAGAPLPIIPHLLAETPGTLAEMVRKVEGLENLLAIEIGLPPHCNATILRDFAHAAEGELPTVISLEPGYLPELLEPLMDLQPAAVHLHAPRGTLPDGDGSIISGRLYGPAVFPLALGAVQNLAGSGLRIIAGGGIFSRAQAQATLNAGAFALSLSAVLWQIDAQKVFFEPTP